MMNPPYWSDALEFMDGEANTPPINSDFGTSKASSLRSMRCQNLSDLGSGFAERAHSSPTKSHSSTPDGEFCASC
jgi:hypothetical protein